MSDYKRFQNILIETLGLLRPPVAVAFCKAPPRGVPKFHGLEPSGCSFWRLAARGKVFYTEKSDHWNCVLGSRTHSVPLPPERQKDLQETIGLMSGVGYIRTDELKQIPELAFIPEIIVYAPLEKTPVEPDVVLMSGKPGRLMYLNEAAIRAKVVAPLGVLGRPTCMIVPVAMSSGAAASAGCMGNRIYTDVQDDELYMGIAGREIEKVVVALETIVTANYRVREFHLTRRTLASE